MELTTGDDLKREGSALQHCVASYSYDCARGHSAIWSLRRRTSRGNLRSVITVEVDLRADGYLVLLTGAFFAVFGDQ